MTEISTAYDRLPYDSKPIPFAHPARLGAVASLSGLKPAPAGSCRLLDVGCADGAHVVALAAAYPKSDFMGVDSARGHVSAAERVREDLGLENLSVQRADVAALELEPESFDYVVAHGFYSWVEPPVRDALLALLRRVLRPNGVAFLSHNVSPGWHARLEVRRIISGELDAGLEPAARASRIRDLSTSFAAAISGTSAEAQAIKAAFTELSRRSDSVILYDWFNDVCEPIYFQDFARQLAGHGLRYLSDAVPALTHPARLSTEGRRLLQRIGDDTPRREACVDVLTGLTFRQSLVVRADVAVARSPEQAIARLWAGCDATPDGESTEAGKTMVSFKKPGGARLTVADPTAVALLTELVAAWPEYRDLPALQRRAGSGASAVPRILLELHAAGVLDLRSDAPSCVRRAGDRPATTALVRWQAARGLRLTNQHHFPVEFPGRQAAALLELLDGTRDRRALEAGLPQSALDAHLQRFEKLSLLVG